MKKVIKITIIIIFILLTLSGVSIAQSSITIQTDKSNIQKDEEITIKINITNTQVASLTLQIYFDTTRLEYISGPENSNYINNSIIYTWVDENGESNTQIEIGDFVFKSIEEGTANIIATGEFYNSNEQNIQIENSNIEIKIGQEAEKQMQAEEQIQTGEEEKVEPNNTNLKILRLNHEGITPEFNKNIKQYYFIADTTIQNLTITAIPENKDATVKITGNTDLKIGLNIITINVETKDKLNKSEYRINVTKTADIQKANANLETLAIKQIVLNPEYSPNIHSYSVEVPNNIDKLDILAIPESLNAEVTIYGNQALNYGQNRIKITVTAEDKITKKTYEITAYRRNEQEEIEKQEEQEIQAQKLSAILEEKENETSIEQTNNTTSATNNTTNKKQIFIPIIILAIILVVGITIYKRRKKA